MGNAPNAKQIELWNASTGSRWVLMQRTLDAQLEPYGRAVLDAAAPRAGERVLDVGCGCGATTLELAERVGARGAVTGVDVSAPMLERAQAAAREAGLSNVSFRRADVQVHEFSPSAYDLAFSRFGVMFFEDPVAAFRNVRRALAPTGRLAFICWQSPQQNPWLVVPTMAAMQHLTVEMPSDPHAPGPFAFADGERVRGILEAAGFCDVRAEDLRRDFEIRGGVADALELLLRLGPVERPFAEAPPEKQRAVVAGVTAALEPFVRDGVVRMPSASWVFSAKASSSR
jgi:SAM-dependent methyltransferase